MWFSKVLLCLLYSTGACGLWPLPRDLHTGTSLVQLSPALEIQIERPAGVRSSADLDAAIERTKYHLLHDKHQHLSEDRGEIHRAFLSKAPNLSSLILSLTSWEDAQSILAETVKPLSDRREGYTLRVPDDGSPATIEAETSLGLLRGLTTFEQLWHWLDEAENGLVYTSLAPVAIINDAPAYPYRGFMLDTSRNFFPVKDLERTFDAMSMVKMSVFHWHVVDSQSFPLDIPGFSELSQKGAYSQQERYSTEDIQHIVKYAGERGIDVLMEVDVPGHTASIAKSHPEHIACPWRTPWNTYALEPPAGQLRISSASTREFTASLLQGIAQTLPSSMFGTGGDEINIQCYLDDEQSQEELKAAGYPLNERGIDQMLDNFIQTTHGALDRVKKTPVVWEEIALNHDLTTLSNNTIVTIWKDSGRAVEAVSKGFRIVHAPSNYFYLDCGGGGWLGDWPAGNSWCDPFKTWQKAFIFDPLDAIHSSQQHLVLGGQQLLWTEQSSPENLDSIVWPRAAASAEVFWSGAIKGTNRTVNSALPRLHDIRYRMVQRGIKAIALQPHWCALNPEECNAGSRAQGRPWSHHIGRVKTKVRSHLHRLWAIYGRGLFEL